MKAPKELSRAGKIWWRELTKDSEFDASGYLLLSEMFKAWEETQTAEDMLKKEGVVLKSGNVFKKNPWLEALKISRSHFLQAWRALGFGAEPNPPGRPPESGFRRYEDET